MSTDKAIELLRRQLKTHSTARLHQMLADLLAKTHDEEQALEHYTIGTYPEFQVPPMQQKVRLGKIGTLIMSRAIIAN